MSLRQDAAKQCFKEGFNCAQAVFSAFAGDFGIEAKDALRIARGFGGGMARTGEVCGAVTGAFMVMGCAQNSVVEAEAKEASYSQIREFTRRFKELHGSTLCRELLGCNLDTEEGKKLYRESNLGASVCLPCICDATALVEEIVLVKKA